MGKRLIIPGIGGPIPKHPSRPKDLVPQATVGDLIDLLETMDRDCYVCMSTHQQFAEGAVSEYCYLFVNANLGQEANGKPYCGFIVKDDDRAHDLKARDFIKLTDMIRGTGKRDEYLDVLRRGQERKPGVLVPKDFQELVRRGQERVKDAIAPPRRKWWEFWK